MMAATTHFKLGLLVLALLAGLGATLLLLGVRTQPTRTFHTYFDESVHGLETGALVKYRGVRIGRVDKIRIAPDRQHVDVALSIDRRRAAELALADNPARLRASLVVVGITGIKLVDLEQVDPWDHPPPPLPFPPQIPYIPASVSLLTQLERSLEGTGDRIPVLVERLIEAFSRFEGVMSSVADQRIPARLSSVLTSADAAAGDLRETMKDLDRAELPAKLSKTVAALDRAIAKLDRAASQVDRVASGVGGDEGLVSSARRAADSLGDLGRNTVESTRDLDRTLRDLSDAARAIRDFFDKLERQPDMLLKGRGGTR